MHDAIDENQRAYYIATHFLKRKKQHGLAQHYEASISIPSTLFSLAGDTAKMRKEFTSDLKQTFFNHKKKNHIHLDMVYFINGTDKNDEELQHMTDRVVTFAMKQPSWGQPRPMQWVPLELQISNIRMQNVYIITKDDLRNVNKLNNDLAFNWSSVRRLSFIPAFSCSLAYTIIGTTLNVWPLKEKENMSCIYHKAAILNVVDDNELRLWIEDDMIELYITNQTSIFAISPDILASIQECLTRNLESTLEFYYKSFGGQFKHSKLAELFSMKVGIPCGNSVCYISLEKAKTVDSWKCENNEEHSTSSLLNWIFNRVTDPCKPECKGKTNKELGILPSDKHLVRVGKYFEYDSFEDLIIRLGMKKLTLQNIEDRYHNFDDANPNLKKIPTDKALFNLSKQIGNCSLELGIELGLNVAEIEQILFKNDKNLRRLIEDILLLWKMKSKERQFGIY
ncbi:unnamed protein product [Mytilus edulis]|uniref:Death domain-containing protein n=1 Tax=Mytilus edulis TaxID=6550 RepID=A0A8S3TZ13_MYTED|nr:unnamed protein product [Mytilus edulis]